MPFHPPTASAIEDKLQDQVPETIQTLRQVPTQHRLPLRAPLRDPRQDKLRPYLGTRRTQYLYPRSQSASGSGASLTRSAVRYPAPRTVLQLRAPPTMGQRRVT